MSNCCITPKKFREIVNSQIRLKDDEYIGEDGLIYCKNCNEPRQYLEEKDRHILTNPMQYHLIQQKAHAKPCKCEEMGYSDAERESADLKRLSLVADSVNDCFSSSKKNISARFETSDETENFKKCELYANSFGDLKPGGLLMHGKVGAGKSHLAACIANRVIENGFRAKFTSVSKVSGLITAEYGNVNNVLENLCSYDLVVLDDLGIEREDAKICERLYLIVNELVDNDVALIVTTNMPISAFNDKSKPSYRIYSRIKGACMEMEFVDDFDARAKYGSHKESFAKMVELMGQS